MKITKRALAVLLTAAMLIGMVCAVPTVNAEITPADIVASFSFEGETEADRMKATVGDITLANDAGEGVNLNGTGKNGSYAANFVAPAATKGLYWNKSDFDPFTGTGDNASISMWLNMSTLPTGTVTVFNAFDKSDGRSGAVMIEAKANQISVLTSTAYATDTALNDNTRTVLTVPYNFKANEWVLLTYVQEGTNGTVYINDGNTKVSGTCYKLNQVFNNTRTTGSYSIGSHHEAEWPQNASFVGLIDDFTVYNRALSAAEVEKLYNPNAGVDEEKVAEVATMINALETPEPTEEYYNAYLAAKAAYDALGASEKAHDDLLGAETKLAAAWDGYFNACVAVDGKLASFTFEGEDKLNEESGFVKLTNTAGDTVSFADEGKNGTSSARYDGVANHKGLMWNTADYNPFKYTGDNASISMWIKFDGAPDPATQLFNFFDAPTKNDGLQGALVIEYRGETNQIKLTTSRYDDAAFDDRYYKALTADFTYKPDTWMLFTYVQEGNTGKIYLDGKLAATGDCYKMNETFAADTGSYAIGCHNIGRWGNPSVDGWIDDFTIYNRALTEAEILDMAGLVDYLDFEVAEAKIGDTITWNTALTVKGTDMDSLNQEAVFLDYGAYYGVTQEAVDAAATSGADVYEGEGEDAKLIATSKSFVPEDNAAEDVEVYTIFGFRLKKVPENNDRFVKFYVTYKIGDTTYTEFSDGTTVVVE